MSDYMYFFKVRKNIFNDCLQCNVLKDDIARLFKKNCVVFYNNQNDI